jgi:hypothetical protein
VVGTLAYMAPEQLSGVPPGPRTDVFGLGRVLGDMLLGLGWQALDLARLEVGVRSVLHKACAPTVEERYGSVALLVEDLQALKDGRRPAVQRERRVVGPLVAVVVALLAALAVTLTWALASAPPLVPTPLPTPEVGGAGGITIHPSSPTGVVWNFERTFAHRRVAGAAFASSGELVTWSPDGVVRRWAGRDSSADARLPLGIRASSFAAGDRLLVAEDAELAVVSVESLWSRDGDAPLALPLRGTPFALQASEEVAALKSASALQAMAISPGGGLVATATGLSSSTAASELELSVWRVDGEALVGRWPLEDRPRTLAISSDERWVACGDITGRLTLIDVHTGAVTLLVGNEFGFAHSGRVRAATFGPDALYSASGEGLPRSRHRQNTVVRWSLTSEHTGLELLRSESPYTGLAVARAGKALAVVEPDRVRVLPLR